MSSDFQIHSNLIFSHVDVNKEYSNDMFGGGVFQLNDVNLSSGGENKVDSNTTLELKPSDPTAEVLLNNL